MRAPITVLVCRVGEAATVETMDDTPVAAKQIVGGYFAVWPLVRDDRGELVLYCNEEGETQRLPFNRLVRNGKGEPRRIVGAFFFGRTVDGGAAASLSDDDVATCRALLMSPQSDRPIGARS